MKLKDKRKHFCPAGCGERFHKQGVLGYALRHNIVDESQFEYECIACGMSYELDISELLDLGFIIKDD